jgi:activator of HSP90 ATPase
VKTIKQTYLINATPDAVWRTLVDPEMIEGWGGGPAKMDDKVGTKFSLWGGEIYGKNKEVIKNKKLVQEWWDNASKWEKPSEVTFEIYEEKDGVRLEFIQENVPDENVKDIDDGWRQFYLGPLKNYLESN